MWYKKLNFYGNKKIQPLLLPPQPNRWHSEAVENGCPTVYTACKKSRQMCSCKKNRFYFQYDDLFFFFMCNLHLIQRYIPQKYPETKDFPITQNSLDL